MTQSRMDTRPDESDVTQPTLGPVGMLRWAWRQLTSMRTALFLLLLRDPLLLLLLLRAPLLLSRLLLLLLLAS